MRTVYLGTSAFAAGVLERLAQTAHRPVLVVTRPDRPAGRGRRLTAPPVAELTKRRFNPNLQKVRIDVNGTPRREYVCTRCLKAGKVLKYL